MTETDNETFTLYLRGIPYRATEQEIRDFMDIDETLIKEIVLPKNPDGRASGEAYIMCTSSVAIEVGKAKHGLVMDGYTRYIEVTEQPMKPMNKNYGKAKRLRTSTGWDGVVKMRGLPYEAIEADVRTFFAGKDITPKGISLGVAERGDCNGVGYVQFTNFTHANQAMELDKQSIGGRYVELFRSSNNDRRVSIMKDIKTRQKLQNEFVQNPQSNFDGNRFEQQQMTAAQQQPVMWCGLNLNGGGAMRNDINNSTRMNPYGGMGNQTVQGGNSLMMTQNQAQNESQNQAHNQVQNQAQNQAMNQAQSQAMNPNQIKMNMPPTKLIRQPPKIEVSASKPPFDHIITCSGVSPSITKDDIQNWFRPHRLHAVNNHKNGIIDVALNTHEEAVSAMTKNKSFFNNAVVTMVLKSKEPEPVGWSTY